MARPRAIRLARHFVQRRRIDITGRDWGEDRVFPRHETTERAYDLSAEHRAFHDAVLDYCLGIVEGAGPDQRRRRLAFWGTLALMRCVGSSPGRRARARCATVWPLIPTGSKSRSSTTTPTRRTRSMSNRRPGLTEARPARRLDRSEPKASTRAPDPKLEATIEVLKPLVAEGANPVVFCRFIATADHVAAGLRKAFPKLRIETVTGALTARGPTRARRGHGRCRAAAPGRDRLPVRGHQSAAACSIPSSITICPGTRPAISSAKVASIASASRAGLVRSALLFSPDSAIDGAVLDVILRKAEAIRKATGVTVPLPEERGAVTSALMNAVLLRKGRARQLSLDLGLASDAAAMETRWRDAEEGERRSRARFAQNAIKPEEVMPEWQRWREPCWAGPTQVHRFVERAMSRLDAPLEPARAGTVRAHLAALPTGGCGAARRARTRRAPCAWPSTSRRRPARRWSAAAIRLPATSRRGSASKARSTRARARSQPLGRVGAWPTRAREDR